MGAPILKVEPVDNGTAEALLSSLEGITGGERRKHASVFNYWLSIRGDRQLPPIRDLDPLEISDAGPWSVLLELIGTEDAVIRHIGQAIKLGLDVEMLARAPDPSLLSCIRAKLPAVASSMQALAFEDAFETESGTTRCCVTLLPFSANGTWIDYVYGFVSLDAGKGKAAAGKAAQPVEELESGQVPLRPLDEDQETGEAETPTVDPAPEAIQPESEAEPEPEVVAEVESAIEPESEPDLEPMAALEPALEPEPDLEPLTALEPEPEPEPEPEVLCAPEPEPEPEPEALCAPEPEPEPEALIAPEPEPETEPEQLYAPEPEPAPEALYAPGPEPEPEGQPARAGFSAKLMESVSGFYGRVVHAAPSDAVEVRVAEDAGDPVEQPDAEEVDEPVEELVLDEPSDPVEAPVAEDVGGPVEQPVAEEIVEPICQVEGTLQSKLTDVRAMAEEARQAQQRSNLALYAGLSAAYDFALDAEDEPEEYLRLVEGQGLKIQLRAPMKPVVKLAFAETCDAETIGQLEAVLAWALKQDLPRGSLAERIEAEGGIVPILEGLGKAA